MHLSKVYSKCVESCWYWYSTAAFEIGLIIEYVMCRRRVQLHQFGQIELHSPIYWQRNCLPSIDVESIQFHLLKCFIKFVNNLSRTMHGNRGGQLQVFMEWSKIINFINLLHCHGIKKCDHVWWYEVVSKCKSLHTGLIIFFTSLSKIRWFFFITQKVAEWS